MLADWSKLDREVACINNRLDLCRRVEALREVSVSLFLCLFWCLFPTLIFSVCACRHANRRQRRREDMRDKQRQCEAGSGSGLLALLRFVLLGRAQLESQTTPPFSPHQQKCIHLDTNTHMRSQTGSFTERCLAPLFSFYSVRKLELSAVLWVSLVPVEECYDPDIPNGCSPKKKLDFLFSVTVLLSQTFFLSQNPYSSVFYVSL